MNATQLVATDELAMLEQQVKEAGATPRLLARIERIKHSHDREALGGLAKVFDDFEFREGVLYRARLRPRAKVADFSEAPPWATLQALDLGRNGLPGLDPGAFFNSRPALHTVHRLPPQALPAVPCPRITAVSITGEADPSLLEERFPALRSLCLEFVHDAKAFWSHAFIQRLESVSLRSLTWSKGTLRTSNRFSPDAFIEWIDSGPELRRMELPEDELVQAGELYLLLDVLAAARRRGAEVVVVPS